MSGAAPIARGAGTRRPRRPWLLVVAPLLGLVAAACQPLPHGTVAQAGRLSSARGCATAPSGDPADYQRAFDDRGPGWAGGDVTSSIALGDGRTLWLLGDTLLGEVAPGGGFVRRPGIVNNSAVLQDGGCFSKLLGGTAAQPGAWIAPPVADGTWYWPGSGVVAGDRLHVFLLRMARDGGPIGRMVDVDVATFSLPDLRLLSIGASPGDGAVRYGMAAAVEGEWAYLWGTADRAGDPGKVAYVARVVRGELADPSRWQFWSGRRWVSDPARAVPVLPADLGNQPSVHPYAGGWLAVSKRDDMMGTEIAGWWAPRPEGPWSEAGSLLRIPDPGRDRFTYMATAHAASALADGSLLVTWNVNSFDFGQLERDAGLYGPRFARVDVRGIGRR